MKFVYLLIGSICCHDGGVYEHVCKAYADETVAELEALKMNEIVQNICEFRSIIQQEVKDTDLTNELLRLENELKSLDKCGEVDTNYFIEKHEVL
jgi:translation initiation factor 2 beta subunit (eIF-2beta)/eIF-5